MSGRDYSCWGWARNKGTLGDAGLLERFLRNLAAAIEMRPLAGTSVEVEVELAKLEVEPFEDEGGASAAVIVSTSHLAIHGWPERDPIRKDGGYFMLNVQSCRDFDCNIILELARGVLGATAVDTFTRVLRVP